MFIKFASFLLTDGFFQFDNKSIFTVDSNNNITSA